MSKAYVGIDIGKMGSIAVIDEENKIHTYKMPMIKTELDYHGLTILFDGLAARYPNIHISFEKLGVIFGSGKNVAWSMGEQSGAIEMMCICSGNSYTKVRAVDWQKEMFQGVDAILKPNSTKKDTKAMALIAIKRLYPHLKLTFGDRAEKPHDGLIDAVLIATYCKRKNM